MGVREKLVARAAPFLEDGEVAEQAFRARVKIPGTQMGKTFVVIGTADSVLILRTSNWSTTTPKTLAARVPKSAPMSLRRWVIWAQMQIGDHHLQLAGPKTLAEAEQLVTTSNAPAA